MGLKNKSQQRTAAFVDIIWDISGRTGGGEAALNSLITSGEGLLGRKAFTFNPAGVGDITKIAEGTWKTPFKSESKINAFIMATDPLNAVQNASPIIPNANGKVHFLNPTDASSIYNGHSINNVLKNYKNKD